MQYFCFFQSVVHVMYVYIALLFHTDQSPLIGYALSSTELLTLIEQILPQDVMDSLQHKGLDLNTIENAQTTLEEVQLLHSSKEHEIASSLQQLLKLGMIQLRK